jgi:hypothetical protein
VIAFLAAVQLGGSVGLNLVAKAYDPIQIAIRNQKLSWDAERYIKNSKFVVSFYGSLSNTLTRTVASKWPVSLGATGLLGITKHFEFLAEVVAEIGAQQGKSAILAASVDPNLSLEAREAIRSYLSKKQKSLLWWF